MADTKTLTESTFRITIYLAGDLLTAKRSCREYCLQIGLCVTLKECDFIYTGGCESGIEVGLVNYPRFPTTRDELRIKALELAQKLREDCNQFSVLLVDDEKTQWITSRED